MSRILFVMLHPGFVRYYDGALQALAAAGHDVHVAFEISRTKLGEDVTAARLARSSPRITCGATPERTETVRDFLARGDRNATRSGRSATAADAREQAWESLATTVRLLLDYLRFFEPAFANADMLRARAEKRLPRIYVRPTALLARAGRPLRRLMAALLHATEQMIPVNQNITAFVRAQSPDLLLVTPLIELGSQQVDYVKAARQLGVRSVLGVASWDNLTSKGVVRVTPDHAIVWNEAQKREAVDLQGMAPASVAITGAQVFDRWFTATPSRSREEFCRMVGLDPARPFVLYVGSSTFIAPDEVPFVERLIWKMRTAPQADVAATGLLIRPHPANARQWRVFDRDAFSGTALWPPIGTDPNHPDFWRDFYDSIHHSAAVVGINTSAQIEAAIVGRPVLTIQTPEFAHAQEGTLHFHHLVGEQGVVRSAHSLDAHLEQLGQLLAGDDTGAAAARDRFVSSFVRPRGMEVTAASVFASTVESLASGGKPAPRRDPLWATVLRPGALLVAFAARALADDRPLWAYALRPPIAVAVRGAALGYSVRRAAAQQARQLRRTSWRVWYESTQWLGKQARRINKPFARKVRQARARVAASSAHRKG